MNQLFRNVGFLFFIFISFLNIVTDLGHKILIQNSLFKTFEGSELQIWTAIIQAMILLPFVLTFSAAGFLADKFPKEKIIQYSSIMALPITIGITVAYYQGAFYWAFGMTFLLGLQSAIYSPAKYSYIKELVGKTQLASANGILQATTILAILFGSMIYSVLFEFNFNQAQSLSEILYNNRYCGYLLILGTLVEIYLSFKLPNFKAVSEEKFSFKKYAQFNYFKTNVQDAMHHPAIKQSIIALGVFWGVNQIIVASFGALLKETTGSENSILSNGILLLGGVGVALGSVIAGKISKNYIETGIIPVGAIGMSVSLFSLFFIESSILFGIAFLMYGVFSGFLIVPLNALIQYFAGEDKEARIMAANNFFQNALMISFLAVSISLSLIGMSVKALFLALSMVALVASVYAVSQLPQSMVRFLISSLFTGRYKIKVEGMQNLPSKGGVLLLGNHVSWLDWAILQVACPRPIRFVMKKSIYNQKILKMFLDFFGVIPIERGAAKDSLEMVHQALSKGEVVAIFPEGHISKNGHLSIFRTGFERAAQDSGAKLVPFYLKGLWGSKLSYASQHYQKNTCESLSREVWVGFGKHLSDNANANEVKQGVIETSMHLWKKSAEEGNSIQYNVLKAAKSLGGKIAIHGHDGVDLSYSKLIAASKAFSNRLKKDWGGQQNIGILLPPSAGGMIANLACLWDQKTVVNLNYTASLTALELAVKNADIVTVLTSKKFLQKLKGKNINLESLQERTKFVFLEDLKPQISKVSIITNLIIFKLLPFDLLSRIWKTSQSPSDVAAILFSSGSEGIPKGVELSHQNIVSNIKQTSCVLDPRGDDVILNTLPTFHAFGLTVTSFLPLIEGIPMVCNPDPTDAKTIGSLVSEHKITIMAGTSTFYRIYAQSKRLHPLMFESLRMVIAGAEKLKEEVRISFKQKFAKDILEGYGTTETTPVACVNIPDKVLDSNGRIQVGTKNGTVGMPIPGTQILIVDPDTYEELPVGEAGLVLIGGTQIMKSYLNNEEKTNSVIIQKNGTRWYHTGDKGKVDEDGFLTLIDRYSRFAKIGGEMVSLGAIEQEISSLLNEGEEVLAMAVSDDKKGEQVYLLWNSTLEYSFIKQQLIERNVNPLSIPRAAFFVEEIPKLGSGKNDFGTAKKVLQEQMQLETV